MQDLISRVEGKLELISSRQIPVVIEVCVRFASLRDARIMRNPFAFADAVVAVLSRRADIDLVGKKAILDSLEYIPLFIKIIDARGWASDLETADILVQSGKFKNFVRGTNSVEIMTVWARSLSANPGARCRDALLFVLLEAETTMRNAAFNAWPGDEIGGFSRHQILMRSWEKSFVENEYSPCILARAVAESGEKKAVVFIAKLISSRWHKDSPARRRFQEIARKDFMQLCGISEGAVLEAANDVIKNSDRLIFDRSTKTYSW